MSSSLSSDELRRRVTAMHNRLRHRGPDDEGIFVDPRGDAALAHRRLSILDLSPAGHQPMSSEDGRYTIVFNGEIYNFLDLRDRLEKKGERFTSRSDTEVILKLYRREGASCLRHLEGMFAFAIWDSHERCCFLARGPFGIKPLYLWRHRESLAFASEVQALLQADLGPKSLCGLALQEYFRYGSVQEPRTLVDQIEVLPTGYSLLWKEGGGRRQRHWQLQFQAEPFTAEEAAAVTREALDDTIRRHFVSDVPVGIFLSGGLDSTAIVALARANGFEQLKTLCISFDDPAYNEGQLAAETAAHFQTEHHDWRMTPNDGRTLLAGFLNHIDQPSNDGFNTYCVSKFANQLGLKVVLSGLGGDELFGGYASFRLIPKMVQWHRRLALAGPLRGFAGRLGQRLSNQGRVQRFGNFLSSTGGVPDAYLAMRGFFTLDESQRLADFYTGQQDHFARDGWIGFDAISQPTVQDDVSYLEMSRYMRNQLLRDSDVFSMAWGLELRVPLVDRKLIVTVGRVPARLRLAPGKRLLLDAVPEIPSWVANRPKHGFSFPFQQWISQEWRDVFREIEQTSPVPLRTWYRKWCLFTLNHFLDVNGLNFGSTKQSRRPKTPDAEIGSRAFVSSIDA